MNAIAAAIGYGIKPGSENQRWLVFDLGGGTLDIAVISTKDAMLSVLENRGNNLLGGNDVDRLIVEKLFLPVLRDRCDIGAAEIQSRLRSRLTTKAEEAKIDLSREDEIIVSLFDVGTDDAGNEIGDRNHYYTVRSRSGHGAYDSKVLCHGTRST